VYDSRSNGDAPSRLSIVRQDARPKESRSAAPTIRRDIAELGLAVGLPVAVGAVGGAVTAPQIQGWYQTLDKPRFQPPSWVFAPVWSALYVLMGVAMFLVWRAGRPGRGPAVALWGAQLVLNLAWSLIFFGRRAIGPALAEITLLWLAVALTALSFHRQRAAAGWLLTPYLGWVTFATLLNAAIWRRNPGN
jgi:translocator protein